MSNFMNDERIVTWLDGELSSDEAAQLEAEIAVSPALQADVKQIRAVKMALQSLPRERAPRNFTLDVNEYGRAPRQRFSLFSSGWAMPALGLAAVVLLVGVLFTQLSPLPFSTGSSEDAAMSDVSNEVASAADSESDASDEPTMEPESEVVAEEVVVKESVQAYEYAERDVVDELESAEDAAELRESDDEDDSDDMGLADADGSESDTIDIDREDEMSDAIAAVVAGEGDESKTRFQADPARNSAFTGQDPEPVRARSPYDPPIFPDTVIDAMSNTITATDGISGTASTTENGGSSTLVEALRDLTIGFLILLLIICLFAFGLGMWILVNRHQR